MMRQHSPAKFWRTSWLFGSNGERGKVSIAQAKLLLKVLGDKMVYIIEQKAGFMVKVPPGWAHCVITIAPSLKRSWEIVNPDRTALYHQYSCRFGHLFHRVGQAPKDYGQPQFIHRYALEAAFR